MGVRSTHGGKFHGTLGAQQLYGERGRCRDQKSGLPTSLQKGIMESYQRGNRSFEEIAIDLSLTEAWIRQKFFDLCERLGIFGENRNLKYVDGVFKEEGYYR